MERSELIKESEKAFSIWHGYHQQISTLPRDEHGALKDPKLRDDLQEKAHIELSKINKGTHYQGETVPSL